MLRCLLVALTFFILTGCPARQPAPAGGASAGGPQPASDAGGSGTAETAADPEAIVEQAIESSTLQSVHNSMGDRINVEAMNPWPPVVGKNVWKISLKPAEDQPLEMADHISIEITNPPEAGTGASTGMNFNGGQSGGTLFWEPEVAGRYKLQMGVKRGGAVTGRIDFTVEVVEGPVDE